MTVAGIPGPLVALGHLSIDWIGDSTERGLVKVQECALTPCVQEYEARVTNNTLFQEVLSTTYGRVSWGTENGFGSWVAVVNGTSFNISDALFDLSYITLWTNAFLIGSVSQYADITCDISNYTQASNFSSNCIVETHTAGKFVERRFPGELRGNASNFCRRQLLASSYIRRGLHDRSDPSVLQHSGPW